MSMPFQFLIPKPILNQVLDHCEKDYPLECCGILAGSKFLLNGMDIWQVDTAYKLENELESDKEFRSSPGSMFRVIKDLRKSGGLMLAVYHSHPESNPGPSAKDIQENLDDEVLMFIVGNVKKLKEFALWKVASEGGVTKIKMDIQET